MTKYACVVDADESTRPRLEGAGHKPHQDHITAKGMNSMAQLQSFSQIHSDASSNKIPHAKAAVEKECEKLEKIPAWQLTKVRNKKRRWSMKQGVREEKFILRHEWTFVILRIRSWNLNIKNTEEESCSEVTLWEMILVRMQYSLNKDHQHHKWRQQRSWISYPDCQGAQDKQQMQYRLIPKWKWKMLTNYWKFPSQNVQIFGYVYRSTTGQNHGSVWKVQSFFSKGICTVTLCWTIMGKAIWESSIGTRLGKVLNWECLLVNRARGLFLSVYVDDIQLARKTKNIESTRKILMKDFDLEEPTSFLDHVYIWDVVKENVQ